MKLWVLLIYVFTGCCDPRFRLSAPAQVEGRTCSEIDLLTSRRNTLVTLAELECEIQTWV
jgi:hypothetical protein